MTLTIDDVVTHYLLSSHPRNRAIIDIKNKKTNELQYIKIRHRLTKFYSVSLVHSSTFEMMAEVQAKSATAKVKPILLHYENKPDTRVELRDTSMIGFEWSFVWEGEKYRWVRESRMSHSLECKAVRKTGDICVAQYLPRTLKDEYFGIISLLGYNILRCEISQSKELELLLLVSLITLLDKFDDRGWKKDPIGQGIPDNSSPPTVSGQTQQKKEKVERTNEQKLQQMLEKDTRRSQKQMQKNPPSSGNSPDQTPKGSPLSTPSVSTNSPKKTAPPITHTNSTKRISKIFNSIVTLNQQQQMKIKQLPVPSPPIIDKSVGWDHQHTFPYYSYSPYTRMTNDLGYMSIHRSNEDSNPPHVKNIQWDPEPVPDSFYTQRYKTLDYPHPYNNRYSAIEYHS